MKTMIKYFKSLTFIDWMYYLVCGLSFFVLFMTATYWKDFQ
jgi:hypothetical protein